MHIHFTFGNIYRLFLLWKIFLNMILWNIGIVCFIIELHQFTSGTLYHKKENKTYKFDHCTIAVIAASRPLQIDTERANPIGAVLSCFFFCFFFFVFVFFFFFFFWFF
jgi:hypothetical protein